VKKIRVSFKFNKNNEYFTCRPTDKHLQSVRKMYQLDANNFIMILSHKSSWYIFLTYIYDARSHLHQIYNHFALNTS